MIGKGVSLQKSIIKCCNRCYFASLPGINYTIDGRTLVESSGHYFNNWLKYTIIVFIYFCIMRRNSSQSIPGEDAKQLHQLQHCFTIHCFYHGKNKLSCSEVFMNCILQRSSFQVAFEPDASGQSASSHS